MLLGQPHTAAGDVYQLTATLYALLSGRPPSEVQGPSTLLKERLARLRKPVDPLPGVDEDLMGLLRDGLAFAPADRPTAAQFRDRLAALNLAASPAVPTGHGSTAVKTRPPVRRTVLALVAVTVVSLLVLLFGASGVYLYEIDRSVTANINREIDLPPENTAGDQRPTKDPVADDTLQYLLIGTDAGDPELDRDGRSDSLMLLHLSEARDEAYVISVPRNLMVTIPGKGQQRINAAYAMGGPPLVVRTLEKLTGSRIDHVAMIDFQGFVNLTEDLQGVTVKNRVAFSSHGYSYPVGDITLSGDAALWYVRERRGLPSELQRAENQRNVLKAILSKGLSAEVVADPLRFTQFIGNAAKQIRVDKTLTNGELRSTAASLRMTPDDITLISAPLGKERRINGQRVYTVDQARLTELSQALRTDTMAAYVKKYPQG